MAKKQKIRRNIVTGQWEHYVNVPLFGDNHWLPGIYNYYGEFPITETSQSLIRNGEGFLLSYEDVKFEDYKVDLKRNLPIYTDLKNIYNIQFEELYEPEIPLSINFFKETPKLESVNLRVEVVGGYPYRNPTIHYEFFWNAISLDSRFLDSFNNQRNNYLLSDMGEGEFEFTVYDANRTMVSETVVITKNDFLKKNVLYDKEFSVELYFLALDPNRKAGDLRITIYKGESEGPYTIEWRQGNTDDEVLLIETIDDFVNKTELSFPLNYANGTYSVVILSADRQSTSDTITINDDNFQYYQYSDTTNTTRVKL